MCLIRSRHRNCLPFTSTCVLPLLFGGVRVVHLLSFLCCVILYCLSSSCVLCAKCCQCLWIVHSWLSLRFSLTFHVHPWLFLRFSLTFIYKYLSFLGVHYSNKYYKQIICLVWAIQGMPYKKQVLLDYPEHLGSPQICFGGIHVVLLFSLLCFVLCLSLFFVLHSMSSVPLDFWVALRFFLTLFKTTRYPIST